jgi:DNA polymerase III delta' subunit
MPTWGDIPGQERAIARLRSAIAAGRVHHAYLFTGAAGAGKRKTALALASALNCLQRPGEGCYECDACEKIEAGIHPDVVTLEREGAAQIIPIENIRREIVTRVGLPPHEARVRVFLIDEGAALQPAAANSLLKTLEEPPARTMFVIGTTSPDLLLPTIRSRCQRVVFAAVPATAQPEPPYDDGADRPSGRGAARAVALAGEDAERAQRITALAEELAAARGEGGAALAARIGEGKGDAPFVVGAAAAVLHRTAKAQLAAGDAAGARVSAERGRQLLLWQQAMLVHNANHQLSIEAIVVELAKAVA